MKVMCSDGEVNVFGYEFPNCARFLLPILFLIISFIVYYSGDKYFIGTNDDRGLTIWNHNSLPVSGGAHWIIPPTSDLNSCVVYGVVTFDTPYEGRQHGLQQVQVFLCE